MLNNTREIRFNHHIVQTHNNSVLRAGLKIVLWIYCVALSKTSESMMVTFSLTV